MDQDKQEIQQEQPNLNVSDIDIALQAIQLAYDRKAYKMEEFGQIYQTVLRLDAWLKAFRQLADENKTDETDKGKE